ncbi:MULTISPECIES: IclR family transcriptional regulator [Pseudomonas syringae group]|uniref:IclR family transcriptional regulator n=4 Tax=Pseudomonas syringae group TaxID=136849 RepID=A0AAW4E068_PSESX|nr:MULTISPECIES: IclR family transcriptional regulator [Pseudomonas syringae group]AVI85205.1 IclR family transcriptional regulator [Pseudomonas syringae pv. tomato]EEB57858.1 transcriptional regulator, IclR family [Pseudomonas syringae pv. tomato T1]KGK93203.1 IclR family transcriptional regulator [Pseudomonas syringae pv. tomato]KPW38391.1 Transcriptional regulator, IclR family [Pseudomonas syringae pv. apii]KPW48959.1 Transcriptional regulator, IclR family [Pseudomonas syringae pv. berberid
MNNSTDRNSAPAEVGVGAVSRLFAVLRCLGECDEGGERVTQLAQRVGLSQPTTHRLLRSLMDEGMVEQDLLSKRYRLSIEFFALAARAGNTGNLRDVVRPSLLRLSASLGDSLFLLARSGFDAICLDRSEGPYPIRTFTGDIGGRVALGVGQGSLAILAFLPEDERETVIAYNLPRLKDFHLYDEVFLRSEVENVRRLGYAGRNTGALPGMAGLAVPILDRNGRAVAALSVATITDRLGPDRLMTVVELLKREATAIGAKINPFDPLLRRPSQVFGQAG